MSLARWLGTPACPAAFQSISTKPLLVLHSLNDYGAQTMGRVELAAVSHAAKRNTFISRQQCELTYARRRPRRLRGAAHKPRCA